MSASFTHDIATDRVLELADGRTMQWSEFGAPDGAPVLSIRFRTRSGRETAIEVGRDHPDTSLDFCYVRVDGETFVTRKEFRKNLRATLSELRSRSLLPVAPQDVAAFTIRSGGAPAISVVKEEDTRLWRLIAPLRTLADREITEDLLTDLNSWAIIDFVSDTAREAGDLEPYGLASPRFVLAATAADGRVVTLEIGREAKEASGADDAEDEARRVYVRHAALPHVFTASAAPLEGLSRPRGLRLQRSRNERCQARRDIGQRAPQERAAQQPLRSRPSAQQRRCPAIEGQHCAQRRSNSAFCERVSRNSSAFSSAIALCAATELSKSRCSSVK